ncbi:hypothetical protein CROQUDRAFT_342885 [Cronartium quercuum f. sp. fusiforme G11]|uniref:Uncharacterized protein n=1 Tax=Cronartium quercuum f. sp. fusiforme G11 TaxID=708437 RepID=A0A9P6NS53_9BASI|nr:hypothetical protein CROQUDRAFT_342885 [Cronartium quercuum f. sp. fusiforme G11]
MACGNAQVSYHSPGLLQELWSIFQYDQSIESVHFNTLNARLRKVLPDSSFSLSASLQALHDVGLIQRSTSSHKRSNYGRWTLVPGVMRSLEVELAKLEGSNESRVQDAKKEQNQISSAPHRTRRSSNCLSSTIQIDDTPRARRSLRTRRQTTPGRCSGLSSKVTRAQDDVRVMVEETRDLNGGRRRRVASAEREAEESKRSLRNTNEALSRSLKEKEIRIRDLEQELDRLNENRDVLRDRNQRRSQDTGPAPPEDMRSELERARKEIRKLTSNLRMAKKQLQESQTALQNSEDTAEALSQNYTSLKAKTKNLSAALAKLERKNSAQHTHLEQQKRKAIDIIASIGEEVS